MNNNIILSNYFTGKLDPQRKIKWDADNVHLVFPWVKSLTKLGLKGIIFHDNLSERFINKFKNYNVDFIRYKLKTNLSLNDERFICWYEYILKNKWIENLFTTDLFDVTFYKNPFDLISNDYDVYADALSNRMVCDSPMWREPMMFIYKKLYHAEKPLVNAGVIGGKRDNILKLFKSMIDDFETYNTFEKAILFHEGDIPVFNKNLWDLFEEKRLMLTGVVSEFKEYEKEGNFAIIHK